MRTNRRRPIDADRLIVVNPYRRFRCCSFAAAVVAIAVAVDRSTTVVAAIDAFRNSEHENYDKSIGRSMIPLLLLSPMQKE